MTTATLQQDISHQDIHVLVTRFYERVRAHPRLGPIFDGKIGESDEDWAPHLAKIEAFWANVIRHERVYSGNPMQAHVAVPGIETHDFAIWLDLFGQTARACLPIAKAEVITAAANRIGRSLAMGIERARNFGPPNLAM